MEPTDPDLLESLTERSFLVQRMRCQLPVLIHMVFEDNAHNAYELVLISAELRMSRLKNALN